MNVFVLCAGRCGSVTLSKACQFIENYSCGHESNSGLHADKKFSFPDQHIEIDNRLAWMLGRLDVAYGDNAIYVYLQREPIAIAHSYNRRWETDVSIIKAYTHGILMRDSEALDDCIDYVTTIDYNIRHFLKDKTNVFELHLDNLTAGFKRLWNEIGAEGDLSAALSELTAVNNPSKEKQSAAKQPIGGNHSFISRKQLALSREQLALSREQLALSREQLALSRKQLAESQDAISMLSKSNALLSEVQCELKSEVQKLNRSLETEKTRNLSLENNYKQVKSSLNHARQRLARVEGSLAYQIWGSFRDGVGSGKGKYLRLAWSPLFVARGFVRYVRQKPSSGRIKAQPAAGKKEIALPKGDWPKPLRSNLAWNAMQVMNESGIDEALSFLDFYCSKEQNFLKSIFLLNKNLSDDGEWLAGVNSYLRRYQQSPIQLLKTIPQREQAEEFSRIFSEPKKNQWISSGPKISVIMPAFNAEATLRQSIDSVLAQTWRNIELVVVDDRSEDGTWAILQEYCKKDVRVKAIRNRENVGPYVSKNIALQKVSGEFLTGHDADDWAHPQRLERQVKVMLDDQNVKVDIGRMIRMSPDRSVNFFTKIGKISHDGVARLAYISCMFRVSEFKQYLGAWDCVRFGGDSELIERAKIVFKNGFYTHDLITMICLDAEHSLTNHPEHGISKLGGVSDSRAAYRDAWMEWHKRIDKHSAQITFPQVERKYPIPEALKVPSEKVMRNIEGADTLAELV